MGEAKRRQVMLARGESPAPTNGSDWQREQKNLNILAAQAKDGEMFWDSSKKGTYRRPDSK